MKVTFWSLLKESTITQALLTVILVLTLCTLFLQGREIPELLALLCVMVVGHWMGSKTGFAQGQTNVLKEIEKVQHGD